MHTKGIRRDGEHRVRPRKRLGACTKRLKVIARRDHIGVVLRQVSEEVIKVAGVVIDRARGDEAVNRPGAVLPGVGAAIQRPVDMAKRDCRDLVANRGCSSVGSKPDHDLDLLVSLRRRVDGGEERVVGNVPFDVVSRVPNAQVSLGCDAVAITHRDLRPVPLRWQGGDAAQLGWGFVEDSVGIALHVILASLPCPLALPGNPASAFGVQGRALLAGCRRVLTPGVVIEDKAGSRINLVLAEC